MKKHLILIFLIILLGNQVIEISARQISIAQFGLMPNTGENALPYVQMAIRECKTLPDVTLYFPKGRYDFFPEGGVGDPATDIFRQRSEVGFSIQKIKNFTLDGGGSEFIFHGRMQIAGIDSCEGVSLRNFSVDWDRPLISQGEIIGIGSDYIDIHVDRDQYPYAVENGKVLFEGEGWKLPVLTMYSTLYDAENKEILYNTWDASLGDVFEQKAVEVDANTLRFYGKPAIQPPLGTLVALFHVRYLTPGISLNRSKDILLKDITLYHALSNAFNGHRCENITMDNANVRVNDAKGRCFSSVADASHFSECRGKVRILNCSHTGQGDDFINVHGTSVKIANVIDPYTVTVPSDGKGNGNSVTVGDSYWVIDKISAQREKVLKVQSKQPVFENGRGIGHRIRFDKQLPPNIQKGDFLECKTWTPEVEIRNCRILKRHRARGILITTPRKVVIEDNYFRTAGAAILIEGDFNYWFESGACTNLTIRNNLFDNCLTSGNRHGHGGEWGDAVITITPSHVPVDENADTYHKNIRIEHNIFNVFDAPVLRAISVRGLYFQENTINKTQAYPPYTWQKSTFLLTGCREVEIRKNSWDTRYTSREIVTERMKTQDLYIDSTEEFVVNPK
ncbi:Alpha-1,3-galactosidase B [Bacteroides salyersiae]|uniref:right-handed parallel beta-helix repeat-containing protein n=1 Tax=Bacteroides salyersiae TaxID=291644 RepID=UPI00189B9154|nr:right-handed parallel beta-helix repeat-containing protein [Bacteroides salyersiae]MCS2407465.1 right-handed parallel beta-helix repeat-containing protein [Bacteroides salyersiae]QUT74399.1 Alpha-1,3-galactosidase B [Bacteroides salyersiae]